MTLALLADKDWLRKHEEKIKALFPPIWTHSDNLPYIKILFNLKLMGIDWQQESQLPEILAVLQVLGFFETRNVTDETFQARAAREPVNFDNFNIKLVENKT